MGAVEHSLVVLDIDGTVCQNGHRIDWSNPVSVARLCQPIKPAQARIAVMHAAGWDPTFLSGRHVSVELVTIRQIREWFGDAVADAADVWLWEQRWSDYGSDHAFHVGLAMHKATMLRYFAGREGRIGTFVGDSASDREAANLAGWCFMDAKDWIAGQPFERDGEPMRRAESPEDFCTVPEGESEAARSTEVSSAQGGES